MLSLRIKTFAGLSLVLSMSAAASLAAGCGELKHADDPDPAGADAGAGDGSTPSGGDAGADAEAPETEDDAGTPPADFECKDPWTKTSGRPAECEPRKVFVIDDGPVITPTGVSIARTSAGRVGVVYNAELDGMHGEMRLVYFTPTSASFAVAPVLTREQGDYAHAGFQTRIAASGPDQLAILAHDVDDGTRTGDVVVVRLDGGSATFSDSELVEAAVKSPTELGFAADASGSLYATVRLATGSGPDGATAKIIARKSAGGAAFEPLDDVVSGLLTAQAPGAGATSLLLDDAGRVHLLYQHCEVPMHSTPRYHALSGTSWTYRKTIDNNVLDGFSGFSPRLAVHGTTKLAAYYFRKAGQVVPATAELRLATWKLETDKPEVKILDQTIPSESDTHPRYRVAMALDSFGLIHLAIVRPFSTTSGYLEYRRQVKKPNGDVVWLSDIIDDDVLSAGSDAFVDLVVDEDARPHIAYRSGKDSKVRYATRFDR